MLVTDRPKMTSYFKGMVTGMTQDDQLRELMVN